jgi:hypothetical protein
MELKKREFADLPTEIHLQLMPCLDYRSLLNLCATSRYFHEFQRIESVRAYEVAIREGEKYGENSYEQDVIDCLPLDPGKNGRWTQRPTYGFDFLCDIDMEDRHTISLPELLDEEMRLCVRCLWKHRDGENMILDIPDSDDDGEDSSDEDDPDVS